MAIDKKDIFTAVDNKKYSEFETAVKSELEQKVQNSDKIKSSKSEFEKIQDIKDTFAKINNSKDEIKEE